MMHFLKENIPGAISFTATSDVFLEGDHICIRSVLAERIFGTSNVALAVYYAADKTFFTAPAGEEYFIRIHKTVQYILKTKNAAGDRSIAIQDLLLDHDISPQNRNLEYTVEPSLRILTIKLSA